MKLHYITSSIRPVELLPAAGLKHDTRYPYIEIKRRHIYRTGYRKRSLVQVTIFQSRRIYEGMQYDQ